MPLPPAEHPENRNGPFAGTVLAILDILEDLNNRVMQAELDDEGGNWEPQRRTEDAIQKLRKSLADQA